MGRGSSNFLLIALLVVVTCAPPTAAPAVPSAVVTDPSDAEWHRIVEAAKREGKVAVKGPQGAEVRDMLTMGFQRKYPGIEVDFTGASGSNIAPKMLAELAAGQYFTDLMVTGSTTALETFRPADAIVPIHPYLGGPSTRDPSVWLGSRFSFADDAEQYNLVFSAYVKEGFFYNPDVVSPAEFKSYRDLLHPRWKGKMAIRNPTLAGGGLAAITFFYTTDALGKDFLRQLLSQDLAISNDDRQLLDWVGRGQYPIAFGIGNAIANEYIERGLPIRMFDAHALQEGSYLTAGPGALVVMKNAPHPNATRVYLDYLLSREGQLEWVKEVGFASLRRDVPNDSVVPLLVPKEGVQYQESHKEYYVKLREEVVEFARSILPR